ncbi:ABC transporter ATP-binding protein [Pseudaquabacterium pictum]|uniref:Glycerol-3-phosphate ABC transporter ATP-binding protein n=1 Tax=Pseudaquabacterium pictum TaxID=2315236 RepID=A0A480AVS5_9BURK|nr:sn-glycerol-3-phosphate ABC transporter ATP-binding protein UgpC [Rubrivivax pictus]GCL64996.1 glycerol-3-phosphate ABC transporter ATP-binding protein [Rubrivivax pictus]
MAEVLLRQVRKSYDGRTPVLHGIDLEVRHGEFTVFVGPSGCGKSTLLRSIAGLETIDSGEICIGGRPVQHLPPRLRDIAMVFQDYALYPHKTLFENMAFGLRLRKTPEAEIQRRVGEAADLLKITHLLQRKPAALSGGQRQRVAIGRAIVRQPQVFLFDEPLSNLDAQLRQEMRSEIKRLHQRLGATIIYVTHDQVEAMTLADRIAVLRGGHVMQYDRPQQIYHQPAADFVAGFIGSPPMNLADVARVPGATPALDFGGLAWPVPAALQPALAAAPAAARLRLGVRPEHLHLQRSQADDIAWPGTLQLLEPLGAETLATVRIGQAELVARVPASFEAAPGTALQLHVQPAQLHLFDADSGHAWHATPSSNPHAES